MTTSKMPGGRTIEAARALYSVLRDPDDTKQVFRLLRAVSRGTALHKRFEQSRPGVRLLELQPELLTLLKDRDRLAAMPDNSVGRAYLSFMRKDDLSAEALVAASEAVAAEADADAETADEGDEYVRRRMRDSHDLWHVVTGYGGDLLGEASLLAFTYAQTFSGAIGLLVSVALWKSDEPDARRLILDGFARGLRAAWLPAAPWEELLARPLDEVRAQLRVGPPPAYEPFYARELPAGGLLAKAA